MIGVLAGVAILAGLFYYFVAPGCSIISNAVRESPAGQTAHARKPVLAKKSSLSDTKIMYQDNPAFKGRAKDEAKQKGNPVFTGGPRNDML